MIFTAMRRKDVRLLREYIRDILKEELDSGGNFAAGVGGDLSPGMIGPYGISFGDNNLLFKTFISPFLDVVNTAVGKSKEIAITAKNAIKVGLGAIISTLVPQLHINYAKIFEEEKKEVEEVKSAYKEIYERTDEALRSNDAAAVAFMSFPSQYLGVKFAKMAPGPIFDTLSIMTGGISDTIIKKTFSGKAKLMNKLMTAPGKRRSERWNETHYLRGRLIREDESDKEIDQFAEEFKEKLSDPSFIEEVLSSAQKTDDMQQQAREVYKTSLKEIEQDFMKLKQQTTSIDGIISVVSKMENVDEESKKNIKTLKEVDDEKVKQELMETIIESFKAYNYLTLTGRILSVKNAGIPEDSQYIKDHKEVINKIGKPKQEYIDKFREIVKKESD